MSNFVQNKLTEKCVSHVIFDMDGLLLATEDLYTQASNIVAEKFAKKSPKMVTWDLRVKEMGLQKEEVSKLLVK